MLFIQATTYLPNTLVANAVFNLDEFVVKN